MIRSVTLRRALLTTSTRAARTTKRQATSVPFPNVHLKFYNPTLTTRNFQTTAIMSATADKGGVHNLQDKKSFDHALAEKDTLMVLDCFATWCGPCKVIAPQVVKFSEEFPQAKFYKVDVDEVPDVASELGIRAMPTFLLFKNGERVGEVVGANPKALLAAIQGNI